MQSNNENVIAYLELLDKVSNTKTIYYIILTKSFFIWEDYILDWKLIESLIKNKFIERIKLFKLRN